MAPVVTATTSQDRTLPPDFTAAPAAPSPNHLSAMQDEPPEVTQVLTSRDSDNGHREGDESAEDDDEDDNENDSHAMHFYPFEEDLSFPSEEEMRIINASAETSASNNEHWRAQTFSNIRDPEIVAGESGIIEWTVESFNGTRDNPRKDLLVRSPVVRIGDHDWRIKLIPRGQVHTDRVSVYVECASVTNPSYEEWSEEHLPLPTIGSKKLQKRQTVAAQISVLMYNPEEPRVHEFKAGKHQFHRDAPDHGWPRFTNAAWHEIHRRPYMTRQPLLRNDRLAMKAFIRIVHDPTGCLWMHDDVNTSLDTVATTGLQNLPAFDDLAIGPVLALWIYLRPFRRILYCLGAHDLVSEPSTTHANPVAMLQVVLHRMRSRVQESSDSRSRSQIHDFVDHIYDSGQESYDVMQTMDSFLYELEKQLQRLSTSGGSVAPAARLAYDELKNLLGSRQLQFSGARKTKLTISNKNCMQDIVDANKSELAKLGSPQLLTLELSRQVFDQKKRCWKKLRNKVKLEDEISVCGTTYTLYGFAAHAGYLQHGRYTSLLRPNGLGNLWYTYKSGRPECLTMASALASNEGTTKPKDFEEPVSSRNFSGSYGGFGTTSAERESHAYVILYVRNDVASDSFYMQSTEPWDVPDWITDDHKSQTATNSISGTSGEPKPVDTSITTSSVITNRLVFDETGMIVPAAGDVWDSDTEMDDAVVTAARMFNTEEALEGKVITTEEGSATSIVHKILNYFSQPLYEGQMKDDEYHGEGHLIYLNGDEYSGSFEQGHRQGKGKMIYQNGDTYDGTWHEDKHDGQGVYTEKRTGNVYKGTFKDGKKHGEGTTFWKVSDEQARLCQICYYNESDVAFYDCGHVVACSTCARRVEDCPVCRRKINAILKLYYMA